MTLFSNEFYSPTGSLEPSSPIILRPPPTFHRQRSMLMNSVSLNHSALNGVSHSASGVITPIAATPTLRSMSVISLESPRNSIALLEDSRITRGDSTSSLISFSNQPINHFHPIHNKDTMTLDGFKLDEIPKKTRPILKPRPRLDTSQGNIKQGFILDYDPIGNSGNGQFGRLIEAPSPLTLNPDRSEYIQQSKIDHRFDIAGSPKNESNLQDIHRPTLTERNLNAETLKRGDHITGRISPPSESCSMSISNTSGSTSGRELVSNTAKVHHNSNINSSSTSSNSTANTSTDSSKKKWKSNSMQQSLILKKKMIYSKDLQLELNHGSPSSISTISESKFITPSTLLDDSNSTNIKQPVLDTLTQKNKLIRQLNQKWNKSSEKDTKPSITKSGLIPSLNFHLSRKRAFLSDEEISDFDTGYL